MQALSTAPPFGAVDPRTADGHSPNAEPFRLSRSARLPWLQLRTRDGKAQRAYLKSLLQGNPSRLFDATALLHAAEQAALDDVQGLGEAAAEEAASEFASPLLLACLAAGVSPRTDRSTGTAATFKPPDSVGALLSAAVDRMLRAADQVPHPTRPTRASAHYGATLLTLLTPRLRLITPRMQALTTARRPPFPTGTASVAAQSADVPGAAGSVRGHRARSTSEGRAQAGAFAAAAGQWRWWHRH
jgi:hypothetical protein